MTEARAVRRAQLAVATLGATAVLLVIAIAYDALRYHGLTAEPHTMLALLDAIVIARATVSLVRIVRGQRAFLRRLPVLRTTVVHGHGVRVVPGRTGAFCAGWLRPAVYVAEGTLRASQPGELRAILAHEEHHRARRDPLRLLCARVAADALRPLPGFASLADRQAALAELAADAASVAAIGDAQPLASALARFDASDEPGVGVAPERVDQLTGLLRAATIPPALFIGGRRRARGDRRRGRRHAARRVAPRRRPARAARARGADRGLPARRLRRPPRRRLLTPTRVNY